MELKFIIDKDNLLVKEFLKKKGFSRRFLRKVRLSNSIYVNGNLVKNYYQLSKGDELIIKIAEQLNESFVPLDLPLDILYEDQYLLIVNKPQNLSSQPSRKHFIDNLISIVTAYYQKMNINANIHLVNRLDYATSGIVIIAKAGFIHHLLSKQKIIKKYLCLVAGKLQEKSGKITYPIRRAEQGNIKRWVFPDGKPSLTRYQILKEFADKSLMEIEIATGRTHQIRVHMAYSNHPVIGDVLYGNGDGSLYLHCYFIEFSHPLTKEKIKIIKYPKWYEEVIDA